GVKLSPVLVPTPDITVFVYILSENVWKKPNKNCFRGINVTNKKSVLNLRVTLISSSHKPFNKQYKHPRTLLRQPKQKTIIITQCEYPQPKPRYYLKTVQPLHPRWSSKHLMT
ncbi:MAG: hypothetical protein J7L32_04290, partial [Thermoplasmata archaeon]|nr:hypothetical protein [Thermoplasmata archaeon]